MFRISDVQFVEIICSSFGSRNVQIMVFECLFFQFNKKSMFNFRISTSPISNFWVSAFRDVDFTRKWMFNFPNSKFILSTINTFECWILRISNFESSVFRTYTIWNPSFICWSLHFKNITNTLSVVRYLDFRFWFDNDRCSNFKFPNIRIALFSYLLHLKFQVTF